MASPLVLDRTLLTQLPPGSGLASDIAAYPDGLVLVIDKPYRWTSADVVRKLKWCAVRHFQKKNLKVGHAGTLDPLATGVLLLCIGPATRLAEEFQRSDKEYIAGLTFGATTPSYDLEKEIDRFYGTDGVNEACLRSILPSFIGEQEQVAPLFSAKSVDGVRAYEMARVLYRKSLKEGIPFEESEDVQMLSRQKITIHEIELLSFSPVGIPPEDLPSLHPSDCDNPRNLRINVTDNSSFHLPHAMMRIRCTKGTYVRALARDLGEAMGSGAHLDYLRRSASGGFRVEDALEVQEAADFLAR